MGRNTSVLWPGPLTFSFRVFIGRSTPCVRSASYFAKFVVCTAFCSKVTAHFLVIISCGIAAQWPHLRAFFHHLQVNVVVVPSDAVGLAWRTFPFASLWLTEYQVDMTSFLAQHYVGLRPWLFDLKFAQWIWIIIHIAFSSVVSF